jgi:hypothetical protein
MSSDQKTDYRIPVASDLPMSPPKVLDAIDATRQQAAE